MVKLQRDIHPGRNGSPRGLGASASPFCPILAASEKAEPPDESSIAMIPLWLVAWLLAADPRSVLAENLAAAARESWNVPGLAIAVVRGDDTVVLKGFGHRRAGRPEPVTPDTCFPLASCSKAFTTTLLAMLVDDGELAWDDPVRRYLPSFQLPDPATTRLLSVRDLLCHRSGIGSHDMLWYRAPWSIDEIVRRVQLLPLDYPFRGGYRYSSIPYLVAGRALEKRTGKKWQDLVRDRICVPLGMNGVTLTTTAIPKDADRAGGHRLGKMGQIEPVPFYEIQEPNPAGSVNASARDLAAWLKFHLSGGIGPAGKRLVSLKNLGETHTPQNLIRMEGMARRLNPDTVQLTYAMGWIVYDYRGKKVLSHGGIIDGFRVQLTFLPEEGAGFAVLCNLHETRMTAALTNSLIDLYCGLPARDWNGFYHTVVKEETAARKKSIEQRDRDRDAAARPTLPLGAYAGIYRHPAYGAATVVETEGTLSLRYGKFTCPLEHFEGESFRIPSGHFEEQLVVFRLNAGKTSAFTLRGITFERGNRPR